MSEAELETARLLARFKLQVRRSLDRSINLADLQAGPAEAAAVLDEIEALAGDEALLTLVACLRERLLVRSAPAIEVPDAPRPMNERTMIRDYRFGARGG